MKEMDQCADGVVPVQEDCCFSCKPKPQDVSKCDVKNLPVCEEPTGEKGDARPVNKKLGERDLNGCRTCSPQGPVIRKEGERCSGADFRKYKELAPACDSGEKA